jgi:hydroxymethylpyrimidine/phosphomethylpyrimidine kinase
MQADLLTLASMGCHPLSVLTGLTVQDTVGVEAILAIDADWVTDQARALLEDMPVSVFKCGMISSAEVIAAITEIVNDYPDIPLVFDPVLTSGRGDPLADDEVIHAMNGLLLPRTTVLTPNSLEARRLIRNEGDECAVPTLPECARRLVEAGAEYVLVTGTHENLPQVVNTLYSMQGRVREDRWDRLPGSYHGSGCTLASAIAANIAHGFAIADAVADAQDYTWHSLAAGFRSGMGQYIPDRFFWAHNAEESGND